MVRSVRSVAAEGTATVSLGGAMATVGMVGDHLAWGVGRTNLGGHSTSALARLLGPPPAPGRPPRTAAGTAAIILFVVGGLTLLGASVSTGTSGGGAVSGLVIGLVMVASGIALFVQDSRVRDRAFSNARAHHAAAFGVWAALFYCARCDAAWHPALGSFGPSVAVPAAIHAAAASALASAPVTVLDARTA